jgi:hypothetical protein
VFRTYFILKCGGKDLRKKATKISLSFFFSPFTKRSEKKVVFLSLVQTKCPSVHFCLKSRLFPTEKRSFLSLLKEAKRRRTKRCRSERSRSRLSSGGGGGGALERRVGVGVVVKRD